MALAATLQTSKPGNGSGRGGGGGGTPWHFGAMFICGLDVPPGDLPDGGVGGKGEGGGGCNGPASGGPTVSSVPPGHRRLIGEWAMEMDHRDFLPLRFRRL